MPTRLRLLAVACLPLLAVLIGASAHDELQFSGGLGAYQYATCDGTVRGRYQEGTMRFEHAFASDPGHVVLSFRADGGYMRGDESTVTRNTTPNTFTKRSIDQAFGRAMVLADWRWFGFGLGGNTAVAHDDTPWPAASMRLGPRAFHFVSGVADGGQTGSFVSRILHWGLGFSGRSDGEMPTGPYFDGALGFEADRNASYVAASARVHVLPAMIGVQGRVSDQTTWSLIATIGLELWPDTAGDDPEKPSPPASLLLPPDAPSGP